MINYLLEIGVEELPYKFIPSAQKQLEELFEKTLRDNRIEFRSIKTYSTPRRLAVIVEDMIEAQPDLIKIVKGPPAKIAYDNNCELTKAGEGFLKKQNILEDAIYLEEVNGIKYIHAKVEEKGKDSSEILAENIPNIILKVQGSHFMRWADLNIKFSRPIRWIVSLLGEQIVPFKLGQLQASNISRGHRFTKEPVIKITSPQTYIGELFEAHVIIDENARYDMIIERAQDEAKKVDGIIRINSELIKEVTNILEWPVPVLGEFEEKYLAIPDIVTTTVMTSHQRYFPVYDKQGKLKNSFITMANYLGNEYENIKKGNERVIRARLEDAVFFANEDKKKKFEDRVEDLKGITFQKGLGSIYDKALRVKKLSETLANELKLDENDLKAIQKTSMLSKADLGTNLVKEFTELQGFIGADYALRDGIEAKVATGIKEHYFPLSSEGQTAESITGQIVGIADKVDTIIAVFASGKKPTGSADPMGLRRAALGIIQTIINAELEVNVSNLINQAIELLPIEIENKDELEKEVKDFIVQRFKIQLTQKHSHDKIEAVLDTPAKDPLNNIYDTVSRLIFIEKIQEDKNYMQFIEAGNRIIKLIKEPSCTPVQANLFKEDEESSLWDCTKNIDVDNLNYDELFEKLAEALPSIEKFFDKVLVMDKDEEIKQNRIALLTNIKNQFLFIADFSKIIL